MRRRDGQNLVASLAAFHAQHGPDGGVDAAAAALEALSVASREMERGASGAEGAIRRIGKHLQELGGHPGLPGFEAWGIQLEGAPRSALADQARAARAGLARVLTAPTPHWVPSPPRVVVLTPDSAAGAALEEALALPHRSVTRTSTLEDARIAVRTSGVDVAVLHLGVDPDGVRSLLSEIRRRTRASAIALLETEDLALQAECFARGADLCLPEDPALVAVAVAGQLERMARLWEISVRDNLTGLLNRPGFREAHRRMRGQAERHEEPLSLAMVDLDRFKEVNDRFGHATGDRVLIGFATVLESRLREGDLVARWGGEEFAVLLPRTSSEGAARALAAVLERIATRTFRGSKGDALPPITFSAGVADGRAGLDAALADADRRLYRAKELGRSRVESPATD